MPAEVETMMYAKEVPWHGLGTYVGDDPILSEDAITAAGLDWRVEKCPAFAVLADDVDEHEIPAEDWFFTVRSTDRKPFAAVQGRYQVLQNSEAFQFMDSLAGPKNLVRYHTAGALQGGKHIWLLAELTGLTIEPLPGDVTDPYVLLVNGHDGRMPLKALFTSVRVVCQNTLNLALSSSRGGVTIRHTGDMLGKVKEAKKVLGLATQEFERYGEVAKALTKKQMGDKVFEAFLDSLVPMKDEDDTRSKNVRDTLVELFQSGPGTDIPGVRGTAWGALQAVTDFSAHHRTTRGAGDDEDKKREKRLESVWFGSGNGLNQKALSLLMAA
jgi:phage/plasmid-like protein (TIGR03299 family)